MIEMALMLLIAGLLFSTVAPVYKRVIEEKRSDQTADSIELIADKINDFYKTHGYFPDSLSEIYDPVPLDPWGNPYEYLKIQGASSSPNNNASSNANNNNANSNNNNAKNGKASANSNNSSQNSNNNNVNVASQNTGLGKLRKDKNLVPINSDYDLYSKGPDGQSASPLTASISQDDIVRGRNGTFFGKASEY
jgi:general secretion pathway protein G